jgi:hypothetical protein
MSHREIREIGEEYFKEVLECEQTRKSDSLISLISL